MKGCVVITRELGPLIHEIARELHTAYGVRSFCAYEKNPGMELYARTQGNVPYTSFLKENDLFKKARTEPLDQSLLETLEDDYGNPWLWPYLLGEKNVMLTFPAKVFFSYKPSYSHDEMLKIIQVFFKDIERFLKREKPDFLLTAGVGALGTYVIFTVAKKLGIKTLDIQPARIKNLVLVTEDFRRFTGVETILKKIRSGHHVSSRRNDAVSFLKEFRTHPSHYAPAFFRFGGAARFKFLKIDNLRKTAIMARNLIKNRLVTLLKMEERTINPLRFLYELGTRKLRSILITLMYERPLQNELYAFFPLQVEPEVSNTVLSPFYTNYIETARLIGKSLPIYYKLYIKEHPMMRGMRKRSYYKKLRQVPNVRLLNDAIPGLTLIQSSQIVFTNVSTVGWEAVLLGKPVITFGDIFYNALSTVKKCTDPEKLPWLVKDALTRFRPNDEGLIDFLAATFEDSIPFDLVSLLVNLESEKNAPEVTRNSKGFNDLVTLLATKLGREKGVPASL